MGAFDLSRYIWPDAAEGRQPQGDVKIDWSNPITSGFISAVHGSSGTLVLPSGNIQRLNQNTMPLRGVRGTGLAIEFDGANNSFSHAFVPTSKQEITFIALVVSTNASAFDRRICSISLSTASSASHWSLGTGSADGTKTRLYASNTAEGATGEIPVNAIATIAARFTSALMQSFVNGVASASGTPAIAMTTYDRINYGSLVRSSNSAVFQGGIIFAASWNRALSDAEIKSISANPWQIFDAPIPMLFSAPASASSALNASAAGSDTASGTASLAAQVALAGVGVSVASGAATAKAAVPLSAAGISVSTGSGNPQATVTISAAGLAQAAGQAGLSASVLAQAAGAATAAGNAVLAARLAALAAGAGEASGTANLTGGAPGELAASGGASADGTAVLNVSVRLQATGTAQASGSASGGANSPGALTASGAASASGAAVWSVLVTLTAAGFVQAMGAGQLAIEVALSADGLSVAGGSATLIQPGANRFYQIKSSVRRMAEISASAHRVTTIHHEVRHV